MPASQPANGEGLLKTQTIRKGNRMAQQLSIVWCRRATEHGGGKPWHYLLIPHDKINDAMTLAGAAAQFTFTG